jgi:hypothetical protein
LIRCLVLAIATVLIAPFGAGSAKAAPLTVDSVVLAAQRVLVECDSQIYEITFLTTVHERELRDDGSIKNEKTFRVRHHIRDREPREILEAMWINGEPVEADRLAEEQAKREKDHRHRRSKTRDGQIGDGEEVSRSLSMLLPFLPQHRANYEFPEMVADTIRGMNCWRITVNPLTDDDRLVKGTLWVEQETYRAVLEEYDIANPPGPPKASKLLLEHEPLLHDCAVPKYIRIRGKGKAFLIIAFNFEVEMFLDSVQVNPGLPDSLFASPSDQ